MNRIASIALALCVLSGAGWTARDYAQIAGVKRQATVDAWTAAGLNSGLVSYWAMRTNTATTVYDEYGTNTATTYNGPTFGATNGVRDAGARLTHSASNYIQTDYNTSISGTGAKTVTLWLRFANTNAVALNKYPTIFYQRASSGLVNGSIFGLICWTSTADIYFFGEGTANFDTGYNKHTDWRHYAVVYNGTNVLVYQNANSPASSAKSLNTLAAPLRMGYGSEAFMQTDLTHDIDEVGVWNRALSSNEVYQLYSTPLYAPYK
jgi:hypothetical protein